MNIFITPYNFKEISETIDRWIVYVIFPKPVPFRSRVSFMTDKVPSGSTVGGISKSGFIYRVLVLKAGYAFSYKGSGYKEYIMRGKILGPEGIEGLEVKIDSHRGDIVFMPNYELLFNINDALKKRSIRLSRRSLSNLARDKLLYSGTTSDLEKAKEISLPSTAHPFIHPESYRDVDEIYKSNLNDYIERLSQRRKPKSKIKIYKSKQLQDKLDNYRQMMRSGLQGGYKKTKKKYIR